MAKANNNNKTKNELPPTPFLEKALTINCKSPLPGLVDRIFYRLQYIRYIANPPLANFYGIMTQ